MIVNRLLNSTYVDDIVTGADSEEAAFNLYAQAKSMFHLGGFNLRKFLTISRELQQQIDRAEGIQSANSEAHGSEHSSHLDETYAQAVLGSLPTKGGEEHKILGVPWNPSSDCLIFNVSELAQVANNLQPTKRNLLA